MNVAMVGIARFVARRRVWSGGAHIFERTIGVGQIVGQSNGENARAE
jgi:hypothetical protein